MRLLKISLIALFLLGSFGLQANAQDNQKTTPQPPATEAERPKNPVELMLEEAKKRGEVIYGTCLEDCGENSNEKKVDGLESGRALELPKPVYPLIAHQAHASGEVRVQVIVDTDGQVIAAHAISGHPLLQGASVTAARGARFSPAKFNGEAVKVVGVISYSFISQ